jgi:hypothetical protein
MPFIWIRYIIIILVRVRLSRRLLSLIMLSLLSLMSLRPRLNQEKESLTKEKGKEKGKEKVRGKVRGRIKKAMTKKGLRRK